MKHIQSASRTRGFFENPNHSLSGYGDLSLSYVVLEILKVDTEGSFNLELDPVRHHAALNPLPNSSCVRSDPYNNALGMPSGITAWCITVCVLEETTLWYAYSKCLHNDLNTMHKSCLNLFRSFVYPLWTHN
jgi:hypothetical protein